MILETVLKGQHVYWPWHSVLANKSPVLIGIPSEHKFRIWDLWLKWDHNNLKWLTVTGNMKPYWYTSVWFMEISYWMEPRQITVIVWLDPNLARLIWQVTISLDSIGVFWHCLHASCSWRYSIFTRVRMGVPAHLYGMTNAQKWTKQFLIANRL